MSQKPRAKMLATVMSRALGIIAGSPEPERFFSEQSLRWRSGREAAAAEALQERAVCSRGKGWWDGLWRLRGLKTGREGRCGARGLGRGCQADARDDSCTFPLERRCHLKA